MSRNFELPASVDSFPEYFRERLIDITKIGIQYRRLHFPDRPYSQAHADEDARTYEGIVERAGNLRRFLEETQPPELTVGLLNAVANHKSTRLIFGYQEVIADLFNTQNAEQVGPNDVSTVANWLLYDIEVLEAAPAALDQQG